MIRAHVFFSGRVQGVGFRYTTRQFASELGLKGWVKNLADGRVEMLVEGSQKDVDRLLQNLQDHFGSYLKSKDIEVSESRGDFKDFAIAF